ncbi:MAG: anti-sigma-factor antagonist [Bacilli bacterium]|jgi:anti-anti-sigma factor|nr:anti-sigma-factor antagonist [Bacilli bacterium]
MFNYKVLHTDSKASVLLDGDVDIDVTEIMEDEITPELQNSTVIEIDFEKVSFVDSSGIGLLITLITNLQKQGKNVVIKNLSADVKQVFSLLQLPEILGYAVFVDFQKVGE